MKVYDASALLAVLGGEPGADRVIQMLADGQGVAASVNFTEVISKLIDRRVASTAAYQAWHSLTVAVAPVDDALALDAARLRESTHAAGLSMGDRCCLALAARVDGATVVTADRAWKSLKGYKFVFVR